MAELGSGFEDTEEEGFYTILPAPPALLGGLRLLAEAETLARGLPRGIAARSAQIRAVIGSVERSVTEATAATASLSEEEIVRRINETRVRPDRGELGVGGARKRLDEAIRSEVLGFASVGVAALSELDSVVGSDGRPFWRTQEYGSAHNVGRIVYGLFQPGGAAPSQQQFRQHPIFVAGSGGAMHIRRPIPARYFLRDGTTRAESYRLRRFGQIQTSAIAEIRGIRATLAVRL